MKRDSVSAYVHVRYDTPFLLYAAVHILDDVSPLQLRSCLMDSPLVNI